MYKTVLVTLCLLSQYYYPASAVVVDTINAVAKLTLQNYYEALNSSTSGTVKSVHVVR